MNLNTEHYDHRRLAKRKQDRNNTAEPPRTRPGKEYPGGKHMRRALAKLAVRNTRRGVNIARGHEKGSDFYKVGSHARQIAGSMQG